MRKAGAAAREHGSTGELMLMLVVMVLLVLFAGYLRGRLRAGQAQK